MPDTRTSQQIADECIVAGVRYRELRDLPESKRGDNYETDRREASRDLIELDAELTTAQRVEAYMVRQGDWLNQIANPPKPESRGPSAALASLGGEARSWGEQVEAAEQFQNRDAHGFDSIEVRNLLTGGAHGTGSDLFVPVGTPYLPPQGIQRRRLFLMDLLTVQPTGLNSVPYIRELNSVTNETGATTVAEASAKPEATIQFERDDAPVRKIAAWIQVTDEAVSDAPTLRGYIDGRLGYMLDVTLENQLLAGDGVAPNIKGIKTYSGTQSATGTFYDVVAAAIGKIENVDGDADGVAANPLDYWAAVSDRHSEHYDNNAMGNAPLGSPTPTAWGLPVVRSRAVTSGQALVGAFRLGATVFEREGITIRATDSHASLFISNTLVILAERRAALAVHRADWFVEATVTAPS